MKSSEAKVIPFPGGEARERGELCDGEIAASREFVCEQWGRGEAVIDFYAPLTRVNGVIWIHPTWARTASWEEITRYATRIWVIRGSLWNPREFTLIYTREMEPTPFLQKAA